MEKLVAGELEGLQLEHHSGDEIGMMADAVRGLIDMMQKMVPDIVRMGHDLGDGNFNTASEHREIYVGDYENILQALRYIRDIMDHTVEKIDDTSEQLMSGANQVASGAQALQAVVEKAEGVAAKAQEISQATEEQADRITQISTGIDQISAVTQTISATSEESAAASEELASQANVLKEMTGKFIRYHGEGRVSVPKKEQTAPAKPAVRTASIPSMPKKDDYAEYMRTEFGAGDDKY